MDLRTSYKLFFPCTYHSPLKKPQSAHKLMAPFRIGLFVWINFSYKSPPLSVRKAWLFMSGMFDLIEISFPVHASIFLPWSTHRSSSGARSSDPQLNPRHSRRVENGVEHHFIGLFEKVHRSPKHPETPWLQVALKVLLGIPLLNKTEFIFILHTLAKVAAPASLLRSYGADQWSNRLWQLHALLRKDLHSYED